MAVFPDADKWWIIKQCKEMKVKFEDQTISDRMCNYMFENPYPKKGEFKACHEFIKNSPSKRPHDNQASPTETETSYSSTGSPKQTNNHNTTIEISESPLPSKTRKTEDERFQRTGDTFYTLQSAPHNKCSPPKTLGGDNCSTPQPSTSTDAFDISFGRSDSIGKKALLLISTTVW